MRVTFVCPTVNLSGGIRVVEIYAQALARTGHSVSLVSPPPQPLDLRSRIRALLAGHGWPPQPGQPMSHVDGTDAAHHVLERWRPVEEHDVPDADVVIATWWETAEWVYALSPAKGAKVYFVQHHEVFPYLPVARCRATYRLPLHKIVVARWLAETMATEYGDRDVDLVPNSIDHRQFWAPVRGKQAQPTVGFLYSSLPSKGVDVVLGAVAALRRRMPSLRVIAFGSERVRRELPLPPRCEYFLCPPQTRLREIYARCDVWLTASRTEGFNLPAMEAMGCRTPVVSTRTGWPEEAIDCGRNGMLVDFDDSEALARGAQWVLSLPEHDWRALSANAHDTVASSSWGDSARRFEKALYRACQKSGMETQGEALCASS